MQDKYYTKNGEWALKMGKRAKIGLTSESVQELGDVTFVELPKKGRKVLSGEALCTVEAVKAATDFYSPVDGIVAEVNIQLEKEPEILNSSPEEKGWIVVLEQVPESSWNDLMSEEDHLKWKNSIL